MKRVFQAALLTFCAALSAAADDTPVVVELFTSQGCSSCPPADEMMSVLADRSDVIALSLHVDYWDYIGWKDEFADPRNAKRQRAYAMTAGRRSVYTPEMIVNGQSDIVGAKPMKLATAIEKHKSDPKLIEVSVVRRGDKVAISAEVADGNAPAMVLHMLRYQPHRQSSITRGENAGQTISYVNVTQDWQTLGAWDGSAPLSIEAAAPGSWPVVVLIQEEGPGAILAAARLR